MFIIAVAILAIIAVFNITMRSFMAFSCTVIGFSCFVVGLIGKENIFLFLGLGIFAVGFLILYVSSIKRSEPSARKKYMLNMWIYGMFIFVKIIVISLIITLPLLYFLNGMLKSYRTVVVVNEQGFKVGEAMIDDDGYDVHGNYYDEYDPY